MTARGSERPDPLRVLFVCHALPPPGRELENLGGMQRFAMELQDALERHPDVRLSSLALRASWRGMFVRAPAFFVGLLRRIPAVARRMPADVVLFSSMAPALLAVPLRRRLRSASVLTAAIPLGLDVTLPNGVYQRIVPHVLRSVDLLLPISRATAAVCVERGAPPGRIEVVPCGVDLSRFRAVVDRAAALSRLERLVGRLPSGALLLCSVGRHVRRKGVAWFVRHVMPRLPDHVCYWTIGDGPETARIREAIRGQGLDSRVKLLGRAPEEVLLALYAGADLFVMPNLPVPGDIEGFGIVMLEAGASGLPTIGSRLEGLLDVIEDGRNGWLVPSGDAGAFADRILALDRDRDALAEASARARQHVERHFAWPRVADRYVAAIRARRGAWQ